MDNKAFWVAFNRVPGIGPSRLTALLDECGSIEAAWKASIQQLKRAGLDRRSMESLLEYRRRLDVEIEWQRVERAGVQVLTWQDADYPANLRQIEQPPPLIYVRGNLLQTDEWAVAVVGTRRASPYGREVAHTLATELARNGVTVVSGLALGIDATAHEAALATGGRTIAVLGSGVDRVYPLSNRRLAAQVLEQGAVVSEYALGTPPEAGNFPPRNRIISGLSRGVIVVEAGQRSGALITARFAADQGRDVFAVPGSILHSGSAGCNALIQKGAIPLLSIDDVMEQLNLARVSEQQFTRATIPADPTETQLLEHLSNEPRHVDEIVRLATLSPSQVTSLLVVLELRRMQE